MPVQLNKPKYYKLSPKMWTDAAFRSCSDDAKLAFLYCLTSPHRVTEGLFRLPLGYVGLDLGWPVERIVTAWDELVAAGLLLYDTENEMVLIVKALKYQPTENPNQATHAVRHLPDGPVSDQLMATFFLQAVDHAPRLAEVLPEPFRQAAGFEPLTEGFGKSHYSSSSSNSSSSSSSSNTLSAGADDVGLKSGGSGAEPTPAEVRKVYDHWVMETGRNPERTQLTDKRRRAIVSALKSSPVEDVMDALEGWKGSLFHTGQQTGSDGRIWNELELLLRNRDQIEKFRNFKYNPEQKEIADKDVSARNSKYILKDRSGEGGVISRG